MHRRDAGKLLNAANRFLMTKEEEVPPGPYGLCKNEVGRRISGKDYEILKPFLMLKTEHRITVGGIEMRSVMYSPAQIMTEHNTKTQEVTDAYVILPADREVKEDFLQAFRKAIRHTFEAYRRIKEDELYKETMGAAEVRHERPAEHI